MSKLLFTEVPSEEQELVIGGKHHEKKLQNDFQNPQNYQNLETSLAKFTININGAIVVTSSYFTSSSNS